MISDLLTPGSRAFKISVAFLVKFILNLSSSVKENTEGPLCAIRRLNLAQNPLIAQSQNKASPLTCVVLMPTISSMSAVIAPHE